ncbi:sensor histidine kinase [Bacteroides sp.]
MKNIRVISCLLILFLVYSLPVRSIDKTTNLEALADSVRQLSGQSGFIPAVHAWIQLAREQNDTIQIETAYSELFDHYYHLGEIDSLKVVGVELMDLYVADNKMNSRYQIWRQYIQLLTESGKQDEAIAETELLSKDAEKNHSRYGRACSEMCVGYNHRVFSNNVKLCIEYYDSALKIFEDAKYFEDAYVVCLNIVQTYLARQQFSQVHPYFDRMEKLEEQIKASGKKLRDSLHMRFLQFRVIAALADKGENAADKYIREADDFYLQHPGCMTKDAWFGYKIMCSRTTGKVDDVLIYLDSLQAYHKSIGACYPANLLYKAQCLESVGRFKDACKEYAYYNQVNDSVRSAELDDKLSKYTIQFDVDKLKMEKLELSAEVSRNRLIAVLTGSICILILLLILTYFYIRTLAMNKKLDAANKAVIRASRIKSSFIQHITHEIRTPLNSIVGFSSLIASGGISEEDSKEYAGQIETSNAYLLDLVNNVVDIADMDSQTEDIPKRPFDVDSCCKECVSEILPSLKSEVELQYTPSSTPVIMLAVYPWVKRVLLALLNNAGKFTEAGVIRLSYEEDKPRRLIRFVVEDSGPGIDARYKDSIFERFVKLDNFTPGTGLGLAVARQIMDIVEGEIYLDTTYSNGARFVVEWPVG